MDEFLGYAIELCVKHKVSVRLIHSKEIKKKEGSFSGYFHDEDQELVVATDQDDWAEIFTHEFAHFLQWKDNRFTDGFYRFAYSDITDLWLEKKVEISEENLKEYFKAQQACELDAEMTVIELIERFNLPINRDEYIKKANAYVLFYNLIPKHRKWCNKKGPSRVPEILELMSTEFMDPDVMPDGYEELVIKHCFEEQKPWWRRWTRT